MQPKILKDMAILIDDGAKQALLKKGSSLLPSGIKELVGEFKRGDIIELYSLKKEKIAFGQVNYSSSELNKIKGLHSRQILATLGYALEPEVIHRDNLVVL